MPVADIRHLLETLLEVEETTLQKLELVITEEDLRWFGHVLQMDDGRRLEMV